MSTSRSGGTARPPSSTRAPSTACRASCGSYIAGQLEHAREITLFLAPYVNSYKRFTTGLFAPTKAVWSLDNRTAGFRICGEGTKAVRVECRIGGSDLNPYLACAALLAAGLDGVERGLDLEPEQKGDSYRAEGVREIPRTLREAADLAAGSEWLRARLRRRGRRPLRPRRALGGLGGRPRGHRLGPQTRGWNARPL
jgi:glutamine synthetase